MADAQRVTDEEEMKEAQEAANTYFEKAAKERAEAKAKEKAAAAADTSNAALQQAKVDGLKKIRDFKTAMLELMDCSVSGRCRV